MNELLLDLNKAIRRDTRKNTERKMHMMQRRRPLNEQKSCMQLDAMNMFMLEQKRLRRRF